MAIRKFLVSTADVYAYDSDDVLLFVGKTLLDSSIETTLGNTDVRGGRGNKLQYIYYHTAEMTVAISDVQWNLDFLAANVGEDIATGSNVFIEENITLSAGLGGTVTETPLSISGGTTIYGWVTHVDGTIERVEFSTKSFTCSSGAEGDVVCVRYYYNDAAARSLTISANIIPSIVRLILESQLCSSDESTNIIGAVQIEIPKAALTGAFSISLTPDGVATTPLNARALSTEGSVEGCSSDQIFAEIKEIITDANWYDDVIGLSIVGGDFTIASGTRTLDVRAIPSKGAAFKPPVADLTFASDTVGVVSVGAHTGVVTYVGDGDAVVSVTITSKTSVDANVLVTGAA